MKNYMENFLEEIDNANGIKIQIANSSDITEITEQKQSRFRAGGLLPNECRGNSQVVARILGENAVIVEGLILTNDNFCFPHMWVKINEVHFDLTTELFGDAVAIAAYYEIVNRENPGLVQFQMPEEISFSDITNELTAVFYEGNPENREEYERMAERLQ